jgi:hypothetical protein
MFKEHPPSAMANESVPNQTTGFESKAASKIV